LTFSAQGEAARAREKIYGARGPGRAELDLYKREKLMGREGVWPRQPR
jgi:hypothetical protein